MSIFIKHKFIVSPATNFLLFLLTLLQSLSRVEEMEQQRLSASSQDSAKASDRQRKKSVLLANQMKHRMELLEHAIALDRDTKSLSVIQHSESMKAIVIAVGIMMENRILLVE